LEFVNGTGLLCSGAPNAYSSSDPLAIGPLRPGWVYEPFRSTDPGGEGQRMPFVSIKLVREALADGAAEKRAEIARRVTAAISETAGISPEVIWVAFEETPFDEWYVAGDSVEQRWREGKR
jgi:4-oxalocrotonate tautomerase